MILFLIKLVFNLFYFLCKNPRKDDHLEARNYPLTLTKLY